jgi:membrane-bound ClpP family serine protease
MRLSVPASKYPGNVTNMDVLLNPNVAYLFLAGGVLLALLAVLTPGTGILELAAFFGLILAGYAAINIPINPWALAVLFLGVVVFVLSVRRTKSLPLLGVSIALLVIGSVYLFAGNSWWQPAVNPFLALAVSGLSAGFFWVAATKYLEAERIRPAHDLKVLISQVGEAKTDVYGEGSVQVAGETWSARSRTPIPSGSQVRVVDRDGFILIVEQLEPPA